MANEISLSAGIRSNLLLLQQTSSLLDKTQLRLATGNKINTALDGPAAFFAAKGLNQRAGDLDGLKDGIGQAISTIKAADSGITSIEQLIEQARGLTTQALGALGTDTNSVKLRTNLAAQYNNVLRQIDKLAQDSGYQGKSLLIGSGLRIDATAASKTEVNALAGISGATATNVVSADSYKIEVTGDGAITGNSNDVANAERNRGISNLEITGFASTSEFNFDSVSIKLSGGKGKDKTFTITEGSATITQTFTVAQWEDAEAGGQVLRFSHSFSSGTRISFNVDFDAIEEVADTAGVGTSVIEKNVNLQIIATNENGEAVTRDGLAALGQGKVANGENAFAFDSGTARIGVDERQILQTSKYAQGVSGVYGTGAGSFSSIDLAGSVAQAETVRLTATGGTFNYVTNTFDTITVTAQGGGLATSLTAVSAGTNTLSIAAGNSAFATANAAVSISLGVNYAELKYLATATAASAGEVSGTESFVNSSNLTAGLASANAVSGFLDNAVTDVKVEVAGSATNATLTLTDGFGGKAVLTGVNLSTATSATFTIDGGVNDDASFTLALTAVSADLGAVEGTFNYKVRGEFTGREARFDLRAANAGDNATLETKQLVDGTDANNLTVQLNESNTSNVTVISQNVQTDGQGLRLDFAQNNFLDRADIDNAIRQLDAAKLTLRSAASSLSTNLNVIQTRENYTKAFSDVLKEGAGKLTLADQNEEGANILTLQTRQQLGTISLSLANQAQQAILRLF